MKLKELKNGEFFVLKSLNEAEANESIVWIKGDYDRRSKSFSCYKFADVNHEHFFKASKEVFTDFIF